MSTDNSAFFLLNKKIQEWIYKNEWEELRPAQVESIKEIRQKSNNLIICSPTASGKTEAAMLPLISELLEKDIDKKSYIVYISPLKALINDQLIRLESLCKDNDICVVPWHGDISSSIKKKIEKNNQAVLLITPESLEAMLVNTPSKAKLIFKNTISIVIDEFHSFLGNDRGDHLLSLLNRLEKFSKNKFRRIGLSATVGDKKFIAKALDSKNYSNTKIISGSVSGSYKLKLSLKGYEYDSKLIGEELDAATSEDIERIKKKLPDVLITKDIYRFRNETNLVFPNSISNVENFVYEGNFLAKENDENEVFFPHHSLLSNDLRRDVERNAKEGKKPMTIVCTATLELGIDIGSVDNVFQVNAPFTVSSLRQRLGRSGRRNNEAVLRMFIKENSINEDKKFDNLLRFNLVRTIAIVELMLQGWYETEERTTISLCITAHQILALIKQLGGATAEDIWFFFKDKNIFNLDIEIFKNLLNYLQELELILQISRRIYLSDKGGHLTSNFNFYTCFENFQEYQLYAFGKRLGIIPCDSSLKEGDNLLFAGKKWEIKNIDEEKRIITVINSTIKGSVPSTSGGSNIHTNIFQMMKNIYEKKEIPKFLDENANKLLMQARDIYETLNLQTQDCIFTSNDFIRWFPWVGTKTRTTIELMISQFTESKVEAISDTLSLVLNKDTIIELKNYLLRKDFDEIYDDLFKNLLINLDNIYLPNTGKWSWLLSPENKVRDFMIRQLNIPEAIDSILNLKIPEKIIEKGDEN
jgi:ATP-dependent Lhr-like helicase